MASNWLCNGRMTDHGVMVRGQLDDGDVDRDGTDFGDGKPR